MALGPIRAGLPRWLQLGEVGRRGGRD